MQKIYRCRAKRPPLFPKPHYLLFRMMLIIDQNRDDYSYISLQLVLIIIKNDVNSQPKQHQLGVYLLHNHDKTTLIIDHSDVFSGQNSADYSSKQCYL